MNALRTLETRQFLYPFPFRAGPGTTQRSANPVPTGSPRENVLAS